MRRDTPTRFLHRGTTWNAISSNGMEREWKARRAFFIAASPLLPALLWPVPGRLPSGRSGSRSTSIYYRDRIVGYAFLVVRVRTRLPLGDEPRVDISLAARRHRSRAASVARK